MTLTPGTVVERYVIEGVIGEGAMAVVYRARHRELGSLHAIKQLTHRAPEVSERLVQEGRLQSTLNHPNVLNVTDLVYIDGSPALVMEYIAGPTLRQLMATEQLSVQQADALVQGLLRGVAAAHAHGLVHRDLKPSNILIAVTETALVPKIADFGLAKVLKRENLDMSATQTGSAMGTPAYMAPEQIQDSSSVDTRADVFALGAILYELVSGQRCFQEEKLLDLWKDICAGRFTPLSEQNPDLPERMCKAVKGALVTDREARIESVNSLINVWFEGVTESVDISPSKSLEVWPQTIRDKTAALASKVTDTSDASDTSLALQQTMAAHLDSARMGAEVNTPTSATLSPANRPTETQSEPPTSKALSRIPAWAWVLGVALLLFATWTMTRVAQPTRAPEREATLAAHATPEDMNTAQSLDVTSDGDTPANLLRLPTDNEAHVLRLKHAKEALLTGSLARSDLSLAAITGSDAEALAVRALRGLTHLLQGRSMLASISFKRGTRAASETQGALDTMVTLAAKSLRGTDTPETLIEQWRTLQATQHDPIVTLTYLTTAQRLFSSQAYQAELKRSIDALPNSPTLKLIKLHELKERDALQVLLDEARTASADYPSYAAFKVIRFWAMTQLGQLEAAEVGLTDLLRSQSDVFDARMLLADIYLKQGREGERMTQFMHLMSDTVPPLTQLDFLAKHGQSFANQGRLAEANKLWRFCAEQGNRDGYRNAAMQCVLNAIDAHRLLQVPLASSDWAARARTLTSEPEVATEVRLRHSLMTLRAQAEEGLRATPAVSADARALLKRVLALEDGALPARLNHALSEALTWSLALQDNDLDTLRELLAETKTRSILDGRRPCVLEARRAEAGGALKDDAMTSAALQAITRGECSPAHGFGGLVRAKAQVALAEYLLEADQPKEAEAALKAFHKAWRGADTTLTLWGQASALKARL